MCHAVSDCAMKTVLAEYRIVHRLASIAAVVVSVEQAPFVVSFETSISRCNSTHSITTFYGGASESLAHSAPQLYERQIKGASRLPPGRAALLEGRAADALYAMHDASCLASGSPWMCT